MEAASRRDARGDAAAIGRRIRAALILAGKSSSDVAPELNISTRTFDRTIGGERLPREWELRRLAELLPVPAWFLLEGFEGLPSAGERSADVSDVLLELRALDRKFDELDPREAMSRLEAVADRLEEASRR